MKNKIISILFCLVLCILFTMQSFAVSPYSSVTQNTNQVQILFDYLQNDIAFDPIREYIIMRSGEFEYVAYFNIDGQEASRLRYIAHRTGNYTDYWYFVRDDVDDFSYVPNNYTVVGNRYESLALPQYEDYKFHFLITITSFITMFSVMFFIFRIHKRGMNI